MNYENIETGYIIHEIDYVNLSESQKKKYRPTGSKITHQIESEDSNGNLLFSPLFADQSTSDMPSISSSSSDSDSNSFGGFGGGDFGGGGAGGDWGSSNDSSSSDSSSSYDSGSTDNSSSFSGSDSSF